MNTTAEADRATALSLTASAALELASDPSHPLAGDVEKADIVAVGVPDEFGVEAHRDAEPTVLIGFLSRLFPETTWLATASLAHDYPYNIARRIASLSAFTGARVGLALTQDETVLTRERPTTIAESTTDAILAIRRLWETWPLDSVIADRERRVFVDSERIRLAAHHGVWSTRGPLQVPVAADDIPVIAVWGDEIGDGADIAIIRHSAGGSIELVGAKPRRTEASTTLRKALGLRPPAPALTAGAPAFQRTDRIQ